MLIGNDVVDIGAAGARDKAGDRRFVDRVFRAEERRLINESPDPTLTLWRLWAAKEAAYKVARKLDPSLAFAHRDFAVDPASGVVVLGRRRVAFTSVQGDGYVHATALAAGTDGPATAAGALLSRVARLGEVPTAGPTPSPAELASCHSPESVAVRALARDLLRECGVTGAEIVRPPGLPGDGSPSRPRPPLVLLSGQPVPGLDLSLSHDGRFVAAAVCRAGGRGHGASESLRPAASSVRFRRRGEGREVSR